MKKNISIQIATIALMAIALTSILFKVYQGYFQKDTFENGLNYKVNYDFEFKSDGEEDFFVKALLPSSNSRQTISDLNNTYSTGSFENNSVGENSLGLWNGSTNGEKESIKYSFHVQVKPVRYDIGGTDYASIVNHGSAFIQPSTFIESRDPRITKLAKELKGQSNSADEIITSIFNHVYAVPSQPIKELMTATEVLEKNAASCNGKSRLFVALCRSLDIPARVAGGIILNEERKKTSHLWAEVLIEDEWVPFDPLNGYYAYIPANYLEIYKGDEFLVKRSSDMLFDYNYDISLMEEETGFLEQFNMFYIAGKTGLSVQVLSLLMLLPLGALVVAIFRNVIGVKTFGVFLPVLIAISFTSTGLLFGLAAFVGVLLVISLLHFPLLKWGILHVPKLVVMLSAVVFLMIILLFAGMRLDFAAVSTLTFFPIVILTISAEKYARIVVEEGFVDATKVLLQTLFVTLFCYTLVSSKMIFLLLMNFPEVLLLVAVSAIMLGKWIGLRIAEYKRFRWVIS